MQSAPHSKSLDMTTIDIIDRSLMGFYDAVVSNANRLMRFSATILPLLMLLVGSCKTSELPSALNGKSPTEQLRMALLPSYGDESYVERARDYVEAAPDTMMSLTETEVTSLFGTPDLTRKDADARVWQYRGDGCVMDVYFYGKGSSRPVTYVDYRGKTSDSAPASCLNAIAPG